MAAKCTASRAINVSQALVRPFFIITIMIIIQQQQYIFIYIFYSAKNANGTNHIKSKRACEAKRELRNEYMTPSNGNNSRRLSYRQRISSVPRTNMEPSKLCVHQVTTSTNMCVCVACVPCFVLVRFFYISKLNCVFILYCSDISVFLLPFCMHSRAKSMYIRKYTNALILLVVFSHAAVFFVFHHLLGLVCMFSSIPLPGISSI